MHQSTEIRAHVVGSGLFNVLESYTYHRGGPKKGPGGPGNGFEFLHLL